MSQELAPHNLSTEYEELQDAQEVEKAAFLERLQPTEETTEFAAEIEDPHFIEDKATGIQYGVYLINRHKQGKPVVLNLAWSVAAEVDPGRTDLKAYASHLDRPFIVIDMEATGKTSIPTKQQRKELNFDTIAEGHLNVLDELGVKEFDAVGISMGGIVAAKMAAIAGERVENLITISTISFEELKFRELMHGFAIKEGKEQKQYIKNATKAIQNESKGGFTGSLRSVGALLRFAVLMKEPVLKDIADELATETKWTDMVGSRENVTDWRAHLELVRQRNSENPGSTELYVLGNEAHSWVVHKNAAAEAVAITLGKNKKEKQ